MNIIGCLRNSLPTIFSELQEQIGLGGAIATISSAPIQAIGTISASVVVLGMIGGGIALWRQNQTQQVLPADIQDRAALLQSLHEGRVALSQVPNLCNDHDVVLAAVQYNPFDIRHAGKNLRKKPEFREIALKAVETYCSNADKASFIDKIFHSLQLFRLGSLMEYLPEFLDDYEIIRNMALSDPSVIRYASGELYQDPHFRDLVLELVQRKPFTLEFAGPFRNDYEIVGHAVAGIPSTLSYAGLDLRRRPEFAHLEWIAARRTSYVVGEEQVIDTQISYHEAIALLHQNPHTTLEKEISSWVREHKIAFPSRPSKKPTLSLEGAPNRVLKTFLQRTREVKDYRNGGEARAGVIALVYRILCLAEENEEFRGDLIALLSQAETNCDDNVLIRLTDVEVLSHFHEKTLTLEQFRAAAIRAQRYERLKGHVLSRHPGEEEIETLLNLLIELKDSLDLPITMRSMGHAAIGKVTPEMIDESKKAIQPISDQELLSESSYWKEGLAKRQKEKFAKIENQYGNLMSDLTEYFEADEAEQEGFLRNHEDLQKWLLFALDQGVKNEYNALAVFLMAEKNRETAQI